MWLKHAQVIAVAFLITSCYGKPTTLHDIPPEYQPRILYSSGGGYSGGWRKLVQFLPRFDGHYAPDRMVLDSTSRIVTAKIGTDYVTVTVYDDPWIPQELALLLFELDQISWSLDDVNPGLCCEVFQ